jgi:ABC-type glycerol-3-phosphate transport system substrate-binding protein
MWLEGKLAMAPVWPYLYSLSKEPLGGKFAIATAPGLVNPAGTVYSWGFAAASGAKNPDAAIEFIKWATSTDMLYGFGKEWLNPVPRASSIDLIGKDTSIGDDDKAAIAAFATSAAAGKSMTMVPQYSQLLDVLGINEFRRYEQSHDHRSGSDRGAVPGRGCNGLTLREAGCRLPVPRSRQLPPMAGFAWPMTAGARLPGSC